MMNNKDKKKLTLKDVDVNDIIQFRYSQSTLRLEPERGKVVRNDCGYLYVAINPCNVWAMRHENVRLMSVIQKGDSHV